MHNVALPLFLYSMAFPGHWLVLGLEELVGRLHLAHLAGAAAGIGVWVQSRKKKNKKKQKSLVDNSKSSSKKVHID